MFLISELLVPRVNLPFVVEDAGAFPRAPVALAVRGQERLLRVRQLAEPKMAPRGLAALALAACLALLQPAAA